MIEQEDKIKRLIKLYFKNNKQDLLFYNNCLFIPTNKITLLDKIFNIKDKFLFDLFDIGKILKFSTSEFTLFDTYSEIIYMERNEFMRPNKFFYRLYSEVPPERIWDDYYFKSISLDDDEINVSIYNYYMDHIFPYLYMNNYSIDNLPFHG